MGYTWGETQPAGETTKNWTACKSSSDGSYLMVVSERKLYLSSDGGVSWILVDPSGTGRYIGDYYALSNVGNIGLLGGIAMSDSGEIMMAGRREYLYVSTNYGVNWARIEYPDFNNKFHGLLDMEICGDGTTLFLGIAVPTEEVNKWQLHYSKDNGVSWNPIVCDLEGIELFSVKPNVDASILISYGNNADSETSIYRSDDGGETWTDLEVVDNSYLYSVSADMTKIINVGFEELYLSTNGGESFISIYPEVFMDCKLSRDGLKIFGAAGDDGLNSKMITSIDNGTTWVEEFPAGVPLVPRQFWKCIDCNVDGKKAIVGYCILPNPS